jgi:perosamine synthetase
MSFRIPLSAPDIDQSDLDAVSAVLRRPQLSLGPELEGFERELAEFHGVPEAIAVSSGTVGLHLSLLIQGIGAGDEVIVPSFAFVAVANVVLQVGATPVFAEIDAASLNLDPNSVESAITPLTKAILVVHTFGVPAPMDELKEIARRFGLALIEDACEALGATLDGQRVGAIGDIAVLGFYPNKQITTGEGGAVLTRDRDHGRRLRSLRNQGRTPDADWLDHNEPGYNYRLSEMNCALGRSQLRRLPEFLALRRDAAEGYDHLLSQIPDIECPQLTWPGSEVSWFVYVVRLPANVDRDHVRTVMTTKGIATGRYFSPIHLQPAWRGRDSKGSSLPITESIARRTLALPFFNRIQLEQQEDVVEILASAIKGRRR